MEGKVGRITGVSQSIAGVVYVFHREEDRGGDCGLCRDMNRSRDNFKTTWPSIT